MKILGISEKLEQEIIDLAVEGGNVSAFTVDVEELTTTLLEYDIVNLNGIVQKDLLESIKTEGIVVYV